MSKKIILACMCIVALGSCKKDYQKLAMDFVQSVSDSCDVLTQINSETEHLVYYMAKNGNEIYCRNIEQEKTDTLRPDISEGLEVREVIMGKANIMICADHADVDYQSAEIFLYNFNSRKFEKLGEFDLYENNKENKTIYTSTTVDMPKLYTKILTARTYDYDGKLINEEETEMVPRSDDYLEEADAQGLYQQQMQQRPAEQMFYCHVCRKRVMAYDALEATMKVGDCVRRPLPDRNNVVTYDHEWEYIQY